MKGKLNIRIYWFIRQGCSALMDNWCGEVERFWPFRREDWGKIAITDTQVSANHDASLCLKSG